MASSMSSRRHVAHTIGATILAGVLTYVFLGAVSRNLGAEQFDVFSVYWSLSLIIGFGLFLPVEQELSRAGAASSDVARTGRIGLRVSAEVGGAALVVLLVASPLLLAAGLSLELLIVAAAFLIVSVVQFAARGYLLAARRLSAYANVLIADAVLRVVFTLLVAALVPARVAVPFVAALLAAILLAHGAVLLRLRRASAPAGDGPAVDSRTELRGTRRAVFGLLAGTMAAQLLLNVGPILINGGHLPAGAAGAFQATFSVARIPLFLLVPLQGVVVAPLAALVAEGRTGRMASLMLRLTIALVVLGVIGGVLAFLLGPAVIELVFGQGRSLAPLDVAVLVLGVCVHAGLVLTTQALIAAERHARASAAWVAAVLAFAIFTALAWGAAGPVAAVALGFLIGSAVGWALALGELVAVGRRAASTVAYSER